MSIPPPPLLLTFQLDLQTLQKLRPARTLPTRGTTRGQSAPRPPNNARIALQKRIHVSRRLQIQSKVIALGTEKAQFTFQFIATANVADVTALEGGEVGIQVGELDGTLFAEVAETIVGGVFVHD